MNKVAVEFRNNSVPKNKNVTLIAFIWEKGGQVEVASYLIHRLFYMIIVLLVVSVVSFVIIQLPPGDYLTSYINNLETSKG